MKEGLTRSCPAVSQMRNLCSSFWYWTVLVIKDAPIVGLMLGSKLSSTNRHTMLDLPTPVSPSRHTLSSLSAMAREQGARARRRPKLRRERPGPARASPGAAAARPSPGCGARLGGGRPFAGPRPGPSVASRAGPSSAAGTVRRAPGRLRCRHLGTPAGSPDLPAHLGSHLRREGGAGPEARFPAPSRRPRPLPPAPPPGPSQDGGNSPGTLWTCRMT